MCPTTTDPPNDLRCTFEDAERNHLRDGQLMTVEQKVAWFEEATSLAFQIRARQAIAEEAATYSDDTLGE